jgi:hypothetical protein
MKLHQKSVNIKLDENLSNEVFNYLQTSPLSEAKSLTNLLTIGLDVVNGKYHDRELHGLETRNDEVIRMLTAIETHQKVLQQGLADINDAVTDQISDTDLLTDPITKTAMKKEELRKDSQNA